MNIKWNQVALSAAAGFLLGAAFSGLYITRLHRHMPFAATDPMDMIGRELGLNAAQKKSLTKTFEKYKPELEKIMAADKPKFEAVRKRAKAEMAAILNPEQMKKMNQLEDQMGKHRGKFGEPFPPPAFPGNEGVK